MRRFEERWAQAALEGFAPEAAADSPSGLLAPHPGEVQYLEAFYTFFEGSNLLGRVGLRLALWLVALSPLWALRKMKTIAGLEPWERSELLHRLLEHPSYAVRELGLLLKVVTCMALLRPGPVRERTAYDATEQSAVARIPVTAVNTDMEVA